MENLPNKESSRIFIAGRSQGCKMALATFVNYKGETPLGGVIGINGL